MSKNKAEKEIRNIPTEFQTDKESRTIYGKAVCFDSESNDLGFIETIKQGAITQELLESSDIFVRLNHSDDYILARSKRGKGSLALELREDGLYYMFEAPNTEKGNELIEHIKRGEISTSSFAFRVSEEENSERWYKREDGKICRDIYKIGFLGDVAPVFNEAYSSTSCSLRGEEMLRTAEETEAKLNLLAKEISEL